MKKLLLISIVIFFNICSRSCAEEDYPMATNFVTFGEKDQQMSITYVCSKNEDNMLECEFQRKIIRLISTKTDEEIITEAKEFWYRVNLGEDEEWNEIELCKKINNVISHIEDNKELLGDYLIRHFEYYSDAHKKDYLKSLKIYKNMCDTNIMTYENHLNLDIISHDIGKRTCKISNEKYVKVFKKKGEHWLSVSEPASGGCGIMVVYRFERNADYNYKWDLYLKDIVTNPKGEPDSKVFSEEYCSNKDQEEVMFSWIQSSFPVNCDYVQFGW